MSKSQVIVEIINFIAEKFLEGIITEGQKRKNIQNKYKRLELYLQYLEQILFQKYSDSQIYEELFRVLKKQDFMKKLVAFCQDQDSEEDSITIQRMISEMVEDCSDIYTRSRIKEILQDISLKAFDYFNNIEDEEIFKLKNYLEREGREIRQKIDEQSNIQQEILSKLREKEPQHRTISEEITFGPPKPVVHFCGRESEIRDIEIITDKYLHDRDRLALWVYGMGGLGKTQLCRKIYLRFRERFSYIGWIPYQGDFRASLTEALYWPGKNEKQNLEKRYREALKYLQQLGSKALLFIDNYNNPEDCMADIERLSCNVIISSRSKNPDVFLGYELDFLNLKENKKIFCNFYTIREEENEILNEIIHLAGYLTIAVELLAKTARKQNLTMLELYGILQSKSFDIHTVIQSNWDNQGKELQEELTKHFEIIFDLTSIRLDVQKLQILQNFSILPYLSIDQKKAIQWMNLDRETSELMDLYDSGWLERSEDGKYSMHPLISYTIKKYAPPYIKDCRSLIKNLGKQIQINDGCNYWEIFAYLPYADAVGKYFCIRESETSNDLGKLYCELAVAYEINGEYDVGYVWGKNAVRCIKQLDCIDVLLPNLVYNTMAEICLDMRNRNQECKKWAKKAVKYDNLHQKVLSDILCSNSFHNLGCAYIQLNDNARAIEYEHKALKLRKKHLPDEDIKVLNVQRNLAMIYRREGKVKEAFETQCEVVRNLQNLHRDQFNHPDLPVAYNIYSFILRDLGQLQGAICYQRAAVRIRENNNVNDPKLAINYNNLGVFFRQYGNLEEAEFWQKKAIKMDLIMRKPDHIDLATDYYNFALILYEKKDYNQALSYLDKAARIEKQYGSEDITDIENLRKKINNEKSFTICP